ncbi:dicarboxylate/amino acid:cation symporter [Dyella nitratireducens]|uniref:Proton/sodium-glutamate symport protein n=1 Tax=Dyella nitratireducens TaxID=1849580 RepID=A0ABQ1FK81_9GAMM|nr:dicarboxylate/amino acid:cation symporter [Dyella nitratireducens]GGA16667.1 proton/sodium-glutamate symport protein [Dyella nitratireducens]GLQ44901.1 proton/sodium-glutamate symport protein [Dyella nitratireducens]
MSTVSKSLATRILWGLTIGVVAGVITLGVGELSPRVLSAAQTVSSAALDPFGQIFLRLLFFVVIPLVFSSLASGVAQLGRLDRLGPLAWRTFALFAANMLIGVAIGLLMMNLLQPGHHLAGGAKDLLMQEYGGNAKQTVQRSEAQPGMSFALLVDMFMPRNLLGAFVGNSRGALGDVLPLIVFAMLVGAAATQLDEPKRLKLQASLDLVSDTMTAIVGFALKLAPYAVPAMIYSVIVKVGPSILITLSVFVLGCTAALALQLFGTMSVWLRVFTSRSPLMYFKQIRPLLVTAFSTSSSSASLSASLAMARDELKLAPSTSGFVLPLGATMNMSGTALFEGCVVLFVAQAFGIELVLGQQCVLMLLSVLSAVAVAGIPGGSLPLIAGLLATFGVPPEGIGIVLGVDRILDMLRTTVNVGSDIVSATVVDAQMRKIAPVGAEESVSVSGD